MITDLGSAKGQSMYYPQEFVTACLTRITVVLIWTVFATSAIGEETTKDNILDLVKTYDDEFLSSFTISTQARIPYIFEQQPRSYSARVRITGNKGRVFYALDQAEHSELKYIENRRPDEYDESGRYITHLDTGRYIALTDDTGVMMEEESRVYVDREGKVTVGEPMRPRVERYPADHPDPMNLVYRYILPAGRGYSKLITAVDEVVTNPDGSIKVIGSGTAFSKNTGKWELEIDPSNQYIVRKASFTEGNQTTPLILVEAGNAFGTDVKVAREGTFSFRDDYRISTSLTDYKRSPDAEIEKLVTEKVSLGPPDAFIMDFTAVDSDGMPLAITKVKDPDTVILPDLIEERIPESVPVEPKIQESTNQPPSVPETAREADVEKGRPSRKWGPLIWGLVPVLLIIIVVLIRRTARR